MALPKDWKEFIELLNANNVDFVVVGAFAVSHHAVPRNTGDIDFLIRPTRENAERVIAAIEAFGFRSLSLKPEDFLAPDQFVQLGRQPNRIDIMTSISGVDNEEIWSSREEFVVDGHRMWTIGKAELIKNKIAVDRHKDREDLKMLGVRG